MAQMSSPVCTNASYVKVIRNHSLPGAWIDRLPFLAAPVGIATLYRPANECAFPDRIFIHKKYPAAQIIPYS